uniref:Exocyst subunit Exo70 family protein n=1 Tax=Anthurium amnicola TaxID=1678845 RepID=A0A1D1YV69_9ARAE
MAENGEDKLIAVARHIAKTLGRTETMTDDILQIFSTFDGRFSREKLSDKFDRDAAAADVDAVPAFSNLERTLRYLDRQISRFVTSDRPIWSDPGDSVTFLDAVDSLLAVIRDVDPVIDKPLRDVAEDLLQQSMLRLRDEFRSLIESQDGGSLPGTTAGNFDSAGEDTDGEDQIPVAHPVTDYDIVIDALPSGSIVDLRDIAKRMAAAGFGKECAHAYSICRRDFLEESLSRLGLRFRTAEEVRGAPWPDVEEDIGRWTKVINVAFRILFPSERRLCDRVFAGLATVADLSFAEACRGPAMQLLGFADAVAVGSKAPERLFRILDVYEALRDLMPQIDSVFSDQYCAFVVSESGNVYKRLGAAIRGIFTELENLIRRDPAKAAVPGGGLHPISRYVMNYLRAACASRRALEEVMDEEEGGPISADVHDRLSSSLSVQIAWIMELLHGNLEAKSKVYREPALSCVFLMNNGRYIAQKVRDSELGRLLGEDWVRRQMARVRQWHSNYQRSTWSKVIDVLRLDGRGSSGAGSSSPAVKSMRVKLEVFNMHFEEIYRAQTRWVVVDEQLRTELRISAVEIVLPAYQSFLGRFRQLLEAGKVPEKYVKSSEESVEARINELFQGNVRKS